MFLQKLERETDRQTDRQTDRDRQTERDRERQRETDRETERQTEFYPPMPEAPSWEDPCRAKVGLFEDITNDTPCPMQRLPARRPSLIGVW